MNSAAMRSWVEVDLGALNGNVRALRACAPAGAAFMAVVKADAYGHGMDLVVPALAGEVDWLGVANLREGLQARALAPGVPVLILGAALPAEREAVVQAGFVPMLSCWEEAQGYALAARGRLFEVHLAVDTGMGRIGVWEADALELARAVRTLPSLRLAGVGSHFPVADEDAHFTRTQAERFRDLVARLRAEGLVDGPAHLANSAGVLAFPETAPDVFRAGLALYGVSPLAEFQGKLQPVLAWKTRLSLVRELESGRTVSYGRTYVASKRMRVATLAAGYADGYRRHVSNRGAQVLVDGVRCPVLGRVTMDQVMVDVSGCARAEAGMEAVLLGTQGGERVSAADLAGFAGTIPWEVLTGIGPRVVRVPVAEGRFGDPGGGRSALETNTGQPG